MVRSAYKNGNNLCCGDWGQGVLPLGPGPGQFQGKINCHQNLRENSDTNPFSDLYKKGDTGL